MKRWVSIFSAVGFLFFLPSLAAADGFVSSDQPVERFIPVGKGTVRVLTRGDPDHPPVLLLHGATFRAELWEEVGTLRRIADAGFFAIAADLPGHGKSKRTGVSRDAIFWRLITAMKLHQPVVIGHSLGGTYALSLLVRHSDGLRGAVLVAPAKINQYVRKLKNRPIDVLILWGERDRLVPLRQSKQLTGALPNSRVVVLEGAQHECYLDDPDGFHEAILAFLAEARRPKGLP